MGTDKTYRGWTNRQTWCVALWIDNDQGLSEAALDIARAHRNATGPLGPEYDETYRVSLIADDLQEMITEAAPDLGGSLWSDLLTYALAADVDWREIARHKFDEVIENDAYEAQS